MKLVVTGRETVAVDTVRFEFSDPSLDDLPPFDPGAHVELSFAGMVRFYSLIPPRRNFAVMPSACYGERACPLNVLSAPMGAEGRFATAVRSTLQAWINALARCVEGAGIRHDEARARAVQGVSLVQGSLVVSRGLGTTAPFQAALISLPDMLLRQNG